MASSGSIWKHLEASESSGQLPAAIDLQDTQSIAAIAASWCAGLSAWRGVAAWAGAANRGILRCCRLSGLTCADLPTINAWTSWDMLRPFWFQRNDLKFHQWFYQFYHPSPSSLPIAIHSHPPPRIVQEERQFWQCVAGAVGRFFHLNQCRIYTDSTNQYIYVYIINFYYIIQYIIYFNHVAWSQDQVGMSEALFSPHRSPKMVAWDNWKSIAVIKTSCLIQFNLI